MEHAQRLTAHVEGAMKGKGLALAGLNETPRDRYIEVASGREGSAHNAVGPGQQGLDIGKHGLDLGLAIHEMALTGPYEHVDALVWTIMPHGLQQAHRGRETV